MIKVFGLILGVMAFLCILLTAIHFGGGGKDEEILNLRRKVDSLSCESLRAELAELERLKVSAKPPKTILEMDSTMTKITFVDTQAIKEQAMSYWAAALEDPTPNLVVLLTEIYINRMIIPELRARKTAAGSATFRKPKEE